MSLSEPTRERHECSFCDKLAVTDVHAQWTLFDFDYLPVCAGHINDGFRYWQRRAVDGNLPEAIWSQGIYGQTEFAF